MEQQCCYIQRWSRYFYWWCFNCFSFRFLHWSILIQVYRDCGLLNGFPISLRNWSQWLKELILLKYSPLHQILLSGTEKAYQLTEFLLKMLLLSFPVQGTRCWSIHNSRVRNGSRVKKVEIWYLFNLPRRHGLRKSKWLFQTEMSLWSNQSVKISTPF